MEDIIYILIGVAWIAFSIYGQQRKLRQKQQRAAQRGREESQDAYQQPEQKTPKQESFIDRVLKELEDDKQDEFYEDPYQINSENEKTEYQTNGTKNNYHYESVESFDNKNDLMERSSGLSEDYFEKSRKNEIEEKKDSAEELQETVNLEENYQDKNAYAFSLRNAVIYNAILERPYD